MAQIRHRTRGFRRVATAYATLVRVPNLFTAPPDVLAGASLAVVSGAAISPSTGAGVAGASMLLYAGGTVFNDYFDASVDARERPERPIPSGQVSQPTAGFLGLVLLLGAVVTAFISAGRVAGLSATLIAIAAVSYDSILKDSPVGFLTMGATRGLNVVLGTTATTASLLSLPLWVFGVPVVVMIYIACVTYIAANEGTSLTRQNLAVAGTGVVIAGSTAVAITGTVGFTTDPVAAGVGIALAMVFFAMTFRALSRAYNDPQSTPVGPVVGTCILALVVFDAAIATVAGVKWALAIAVCFFSALTFSRKFDMS